MAKNPFQQLDVIRNASHKGYIIKDCYRLMYKKELWLKAYAKLYPNVNALNKGNVNETINDICLDVIEQLKSGGFRFTLVDKIVKPTTDRKKKPLEISNLRDMLALEVVRMILENVYEPIFSENSHGFRKSRSCHTALTQIKTSLHTSTWCLKGDIINLFSGINYSILLKLISKRVKDHRFLLLIHQSLSSGLLSIYYHQYNDCLMPQNCCLTSLLANIYLHELDCFMERQMTGNSMKYVRHIDKFVVGFSSSKQSALHTKDLIVRFLKEELCLDLDVQKKVLVHLDHPIEFLGYHLHRRKEKGKKDYSNRYIQASKKRLHSNVMKLNIPEKEINDFVKANGYGNAETVKSKYRSKLINYNELDILEIFNTELREFANFYTLADNYYHLKRLFYLAEGSFIKTIANKRKSTYKKVVTSLRTHKQGVLCLANKDSKGTQTLQIFLKLKDIPKVKGHQS